MRNTTTLTTTRTRRTGRTLLLAATLAVTSAVAPLASAQDATPSPSTPIATPAVTTPAATAEATSTELMTAAFDQFPPAPMTVRLLRIVMEPGASTPMHFHPGPEFDRIESGTVTIQSDGDANITRADGTTETATGEEVNLAVDDYIVFPPDTGMYFVNNGDEPVVMLSAVTLPVGTDYPQSITYTDGKPNADAFDGVSYTVLGDGLIQEMPSSATTVTVRQITVPVGAAVPANPNIAMYSAVSGPYAFSVGDGLVQVSRSALRALQPNAVAGQEFSLAFGDAAFFPGGVAAMPRDANAPALTLLELEIRVEGDLPTPPAQLTSMTTGTGATPPPTATAAPTIDAENPVTVTINEDVVNMRAEASIDGVLMEQLPNGYELDLVGGPVEADDFVWYQVALPDDPTRVGWVVADFLDGLPGSTTAEPTPTAVPTEAPTSAETPAATTTPAANATITPTAAATVTFTEGDTVQTTEEDVRLRPEPNTDQEAIDAFPIGTTLTVTGDPVVGDDFTWVPVQLEADETLTGYMPAEFLELVPES